MLYDDQLLSELPTYKEMLQKQAELLKILTDEIKPLVEEIDISTHPVLTKDEIDSLDSSQYRRSNSEYLIRTDVDIKPFNVEDISWYTVSIVWMPRVTCGYENGLWEVRSWSRKDTDWCYEGTEEDCTNNKVLKIIKRLIENRPYGD